MRERDRYHHGSLPDELVRVAVELIGRKGLDAFTLAGAARAAGVSPAAPYAHFADKADLLQAVAEHGYALMETRLRAVVDPGDAVEGLVAMSHAYVVFVVEQPALSQVMFMPGRRRGASRAGLSTLNALAELILAIEAEGRLRVPVPIAVNAVWACVHGIASLTAAGLLEVVGSDGVREEVRDQVLRALYGSGLTTT